VTWIHYSLLKGSGLERKPEEGDIRRTLDGKEGILSCYGLKVTLCVVFFDLYVDYNLVRKSD